MCRLTVRVVPNSRRTEVVSATDETLRIKVCAPAVENRANEELIKFLSKKLHISTIKIISGSTSRNKIVDFGEMSQKEYIINRLLQR